MMITDLQQMIDRVNDAYARVSKVQWFLGGKSPSREWLDILDDVATDLEDAQNRMIFDDQERVPWPETTERNPVVEERQDDTYAVVYPYEGRITATRLQQWAYDCMVDLGWLQGGHASCEVVAVDEAIDFLEDQGLITLSR